MQRRHGMQEILRNGNLRERSGRVRARKTPHGSHAENVGKRDRKAPFGTEKGRDDVRALRRRCGRRRCTVMNAMAS